MDAYSDDHFSVVFFLETLFPTQTDPKIYVSTSLFKYSTTSLFSFIWMTIRKD